MHDSVPSFTSITTRRQRKRNFSTCIGPITRYDTSRNVRLNDRVDIITLNAYNLMPAC